MIEKLIGKFVKNAEDINNPQVRSSYGSFSSVTGISLNLLLFAFKIITGILSHSVSIISDAFNNLSDCLSCLITWLGYRISAKPADREHPFGHGRSEYIAGLFISLVIFGAGAELMIASVQRILHPVHVHFSIPMAVVLFFSILIKLWMSRFYHVIAEKIHSSTMEASSQDSRNDVLSTALTLGAMALTLTGSDFPFDGIAGVLISFLILKAGWEIVTDITGQLLGRPADHELSTQIREQILTHPEILGVHDLIIHDYGPGVQIGSAHAEVDSEMTLMHAHSVIDAAEEEIQKLYNVTMTLHADPVELHNPRTNTLKKAFERKLQETDPSLTMHDFRVREKEGREEAVFDILIPYSCQLAPVDIQKQMNDTAASFGIETWITFDHDFTEGEEE